jgi:hypothetical protein
MEQPHNKEKRFHGNKNPHGIKREYGDNNRLQREFNMFLEHISQIDFLEIEQVLK